MLYTQSRFSLLPFAKEAYGVWPSATHVLDFAIFFMANLYDEVN